jgi:hypothetical protein
MSWAIPRAIRLQQLAAARPIRLAALAERRARRIQVARRPQDGTWNTLITFTGRRETMEQVFGSDDISPGILSRRIWTFIKRHKLAEKTIAPARLAGVDRTRRPSAVPVDDIDDVRTYKRRRA